MQDIADELDMKAASLYNHISSKQGLLSELLLQGGQLFVEGMSEVQASSLTAIQKIEKLIALHVRLNIEHTDLMALMVVEWRHLEGPPKDRYAEMRDQYENAFRDLLQTALEEGSLQDVNIDLALFSILSSLQRFYAWYDRHPDLNSFDLEKYLVQCLLGGIRK